MILCEWDAPEGDPGQSCVHLFARILSSSLTSVSIFSVCCYSIVSISVVFSLVFFLELLKGQCHEREDTITYNGEMVEKAAVGLGTKDVV